MRGGEGQEKQEGGGWRGWGPHRSQQGASFHTRQNTNVGDHSRYSSWRQYRQASAVLTEPLSRARPDSLEFLVESLARLCANLRLKCHTLLIAHAFVQEHAQTKRKRKNKEASCLAVFVDS